MLPAAAAVGGLALGGLALGPWLATVTVRLATRDRTAHATTRRRVLTALLTALATGAAGALGGLRPATAGLLWVAAAAVVLAGVDLLVHRLPDAVVYPAAGALATALLLDAVVTGSWPALLRAVLAAGAAGGTALAAAWAAPAGLGLGDVKLLGLLGLLLGWRGWDVLVAGVFLGLVAGACAAVVLLLARRAGWRSAIPFGPPLLLGAAAALALTAPL